LAQLNYCSASGQVATLSVHLIFAIVSACGLNFRSFGPQFGMRPQFSALRASTRSRLLSSIVGAPVYAATLMTRHHGDDVYMMSQPIAAHSSAAA